MTSDPQTVYQDWRNGPFLKSAQASNLTAGLLCALGLCEAILAANEPPTTDADSYFGAQDGLKGHDRFVRDALVHHRLIDEKTNFANLPYGFKARGRRANRRRVWAQSLIDVMQACGVLGLEREARIAAVREHFQRPLAEELRALLQAGPLTRFAPELSLYTNVQRLLEMAKKRNRHDQVAQALVAAKLIERYDLTNNHFSSRLLSTDSADSTRAGSDRRGDLPVGDLVFEVAHSAPNDEHINKAAVRWKRGGYTLIVPDDQADAWRRVLARAHVDELASREEKLDAYVIVAGILQFVSQNIFELAGKELQAHRQCFEEFFRRYNSLVQDNTLSMSIANDADSASEPVEGHAED
jgi:hypothetical protein